jgi:phage shock protein C
VFRNAAMTRTIAPCFDQRSLNHLEEVHAMSGPLRRSRSRRMIAGVVAGLADYVGMDVSLARVLYVLVSICSAAFPGILVYIICWILIPEDDVIDYRAS